MPRPCGQSHFRRAFISGCRFIVATCGEGIGECRSCTGKRAVPRPPEKKGQRAHTFFRLGNSAAESCPAWARLPRPTHYRQRCRRIGARVRVYLLHTGSASRSQRSLHLGAHGQNREKPARTRRPRVSSRARSARKFMKMTANRASLARAQPKRRPASP